jgi:hypothetical protein
VILVEMLIEVQEVKIVQVWGKQAYVQEGASQ